MSIESRRARFPKIAPEHGTVVADQQMWGHAWQATDLEWEPLELQPGQTCNGFAMQYPGLFTAVYASAGSVWFQAGANVWDAATIDRVQQTRSGLRLAEYELRFVDGLPAKVRLRMPASVVGHRLIDPTYDEIESWADDIMKLFPYVAADGWTASDANVQAWVGRVLPMWASGFNHGP